MFESPSHHWSSEDRRLKCLQIVRPEIGMLVDKAYLAGWSRDEILIAIADAADEQLSDITESFRPVLIETDDPPAVSSAEPAGTRRFQQGSRLSALR